MFELLVSKIRSRAIDLSRFFFVGLDEWVGIDDSVKGSCAYEFKERFFTPLGIPPSQIHLFNGCAKDLDKECTMMDEVIRTKGGIDLMLVGIGMNGHIGFNEPGVDPGALSHVVPLDPVTKEVGQQYFHLPVEMDHGITLGLEHLLRARVAYLIANGHKKAALIQKAIEGPVTPQFPASIMQSHPNGVVAVDQEAAALLTK